MKSLPKTHIIKHVSMCSDENLTQITKDLGIDKKLNLNVINLFQKRIRYSSKKWLFSILIIFATFSISKATTYTFTGINFWTAENLWSPSYPGLNISAEDIIVISFNSQCTIASSSTLTNEGTIIIESVLNNKGTLNNNGGNIIINATRNLNNDPGANLNNNNGGDITNNGHLTTNGIFTNNSTINNNGQFDLHEGPLTNYPGADFYNNLGATFNNYGSLINNITADIFNTGEILNFGTITNYGSSSNNGTIYESGTFDNWGIYKGNGIYSDNLFTNKSVGTVAPGSSVGCLEFSDGFSNFGTINIELGGTTPCTLHDKINIIGAATISGTLTVSLINSYTGGVNDQVIIIQATSLSGTFSSGVTLPPNWFINYTSDAVILSYGSILPTTFINFSAYFNENSIKLVWETMTERDNDGFYIERSNDGEFWNQVSFSESSKISSSI